MMIGKISQPIKVLYGLKNGIREMLIADGWEEKWKNKIKNKEQQKKKHILKLSRI